MVSAHIKDILDENRRRLLAGFHSQFSASDHIIRVIYLTQREPLWHHEPERATVQASL